MINIKKKQELQNMVDKNLILKYISYYGCKEFKSICFNKYNKENVIVPLYYNNTWILANIYAIGEEFKCLPSIKKALDRGYSNTILTFDSLPREDFNVIANGIRTLFLDKDVIKEINAYLSGIFDDKLMKYIIATPDRIYDNTFQFNIQFNQKGILEDNEITKKHLVDLILYFQNFDDVMNEDPTCILHYKKKYSNICKTDIEFSLSITFKLSELRDVIFAKKNK